jgi:4-hydroxy-4-methyl-2-oxoglutarate aldolase
VYHVIRNYERVAPELIQQFADLGTATIHEAQDRQGAMAAAIKPIYVGARVFGSALTVKSHAGDNLMLHKALDIVRPGEVIVCDIDGWEGGPWGELMSVIAMSRHCAGLVIDGYARDGDRIRDLGFPVFARGRSVKGALKGALGLVNHPISCGGVLVHPGDLIVGDGDGVCVVPRANAADVLNKALAREAQEEVSRGTFASGKTLWQLAGFDAMAASKGLAEEPLGDVGAGAGTPA